MITNDMWLTSLWLMATLEVALALYVLVLNFRNKVNLNLAGMMLIYAVNTFALGLLVTAQDIESAMLPMVLLAISSVPVIAITWIVNMLLLFPQPPRWLHFINNAMYLGVAIPIVLTLIDIAFGTTLWLKISADPYPGGYVGGSYYANGTVGAVVRATFTYTVGLLTLVPALVAVFQRKNTRSRRGLAIALSVTQVLIIVLQALLNNVISSEMSVGLVNVLFALVYGYITFNMALTTRSMQSGRLQTRLTLLSLVVTVPVLMLVSVVAGRAGRDLLVNSSRTQLQNTSYSLSSSINNWLNQHVRTLQYLERQPNIRSMDPEKQKPSLESLAEVYPYMYLVSTTGVDGINIARNDDGELQDYSDRVWVQGPLSGQPVTYQTLISRTTGEPAIVISVPIRNEASRIQGVLMFGATLEDLKAATESIESEDNVLDYYIVDENNSVVIESTLHALHEHGVETDSEDSAHQDDAEMQPVLNARSSGPGEYRYRDTKGDIILSYTEVLPNDWVVVVENEERVLLRPADALQGTNTLILVVSVVLLVVLIFATVRQALQPIASLTSTVGAIIGGDLEQRAPIESGDELGTLAESFNVMTDRLNELIAGLEARVQRRTAAIEQRSRYLQASAEVGRAASSILDTDELFRESVELIRDRFDLYYVGLFQVNAAREWAVLRAGTGEAGRIMLARDHRILVGTGMVGWSIAHNQSRVSSRAEEDAVRLASSELPDTRSEAALPLTSRGEVLGALTVQSAEVDAFDADTLTVLQTMADQIAVAIDNARLYTSMQETLDTERRAFGQMVTGSIEDIGGGANDWVYSAANGSFEKPEGTWHPAMIEARQKAGAVAISDADSGQQLALPIKVRDEVVGVLDLNRTTGQAWTTQEITLLETITEQMGAALESALLYETTRRRASREQLIRQITENISAASTVEDAMRRAMQSLADVANARQVAVRIGSQQLLSVQQGDAHE